MVNTVGLDDDTLVTLADLDGFRPITPTRGHPPNIDELESVRALRGAQIWTVRDRDEAAALVNEILDEATPGPTCPATTSGIGICT